MNEKILECKSLAELFHWRVAQKPQKTALLRKQQGLWNKSTWSDVEARVFEVAWALKNAGVKRGDRVAILSQSRPEWTYIDFAILSLGAVTVPIYHSVTGEEVFFILQNSGAILLFVEDAPQREKVRPLLPQLDGLQKVISMDSGGDENCQSFLEFLAPTTPARVQNGGEEWRALSQGLNESDLATIVYTSGTTGQAKGVELSHGNFLSILRDGMQVLDVNENDLSLLFLPTAHILGRVEQMYFLGAGWTLAFAENLARIMDNMQEIHPTLLFSVPRIYEKFYATLQAKTLEGSPPQRWLAQKALAVGIEYSRCLQSGNIPGLLLKAKHRAADRLLFQKVREKFGGRIRFSISGGAPLSREIAEFFHACGVLVLEGYGLTETTGPLALNLPNEFCFGSVGKVFPSSQLKIGADGEILLKGPSVFRSYHGLSEATAAALQDGFFATGDIGQVDAQGFLKITDRKKDLIVTSGGKNVAPQKIENLIKTDPLISNVVVFGDRHKYLVALLTLNPSEAKRLMASWNLPYQSFEQSLEEPRLQKAVKAKVDQVNAGLASFERIKRYRLLARDFSLEAGELTPSLKVKRKFCAEKYAPIIEELYV